MVWLSMTLETKIISGLTFVLGLMQIIMMMTTTMMTMLCLYYQQSQTL